MRSQHNLTLLVTGKKSEQAGVCQLICTELSCVALVSKLVLPCMRHNETDLSITKVTQLLANTDCLLGDGA